MPIDEMMSFHAHIKGPVPRGHRLWLALFIALGLLVVAGSITVRAMQRLSSDDHILQPTDPGIVTHVIKDADR